MDALDKLIADEVAELARLQTAVKLQEIKVATLRQAASVRPAVSEPRPRTKQKTSAPSKGKPKGAISVLWRNVFRVLAGRPSPFSYADVSVAYKDAVGKEVALASIRDRVRTFIDSEFMTGNPEDGFKFTATAIEKFALSEGGANENGEAEASPETSEVSASLTSEELDLTAYSH